MGMMPLLRYYEHTLPQPCTLYECSNRKCFWFLLNNGKSHCSIMESVVILNGSVHLRYIL